MKLLIYTTAITTIIIIIIIKSSYGYLKEKAYSGWNREYWQKKDKVIQILDIKPGQKVADIGAGAGYFTFSFAELVKETGIVYAVDIDPDMILRIKDKIRKQNATNITPVKATKEDSALPEKEIDLIFFCNSFHEIYDRVTYFRNLKQKLSFRGKIAIIDIRPHGFYGFFGMHGTSGETIRNELTEAGYQLDQSFDFLPEQNFQIFSIRIQDK